MEISLTTTPRVNQALLGMWSFYGYKVASQEKGHLNGDVFLKRGFGASFALQRSFFEARKNQGLRPSDITEVLNSSFAVVPGIIGLRKKDQRHKLGKMQEPKIEIKPPKIIPRQILFASPERRHPLISPQGTKLAYLAPNQDRVLNLHVRNLSSSSEQIISNEKGQGIEYFDWIDDQRIVFSRDHEGDENYHLCLIDLDSGETTDLTPFPRDQRICAQLIGVNPNKNGEILVGLNLRNPALQDIYRIDVNHPQINPDKPDAENFEGVGQWIYDNDFQIRACCSISSAGGNIVYVRDSVDEPWKKFLEFGPNEIFGSFKGHEWGVLVGFSNDNRSLILKSSENSNTAKVVSVNLQTKEREVICEDSQYDPAFFLKSSSGAVQAVQYCRDREDTWIVLEPALKEDFTIMQQIEGNLSVISKTMDDRMFIICYDSDTKPPEYYTYDRDKKTLTSLFKAYPDLDEFEFAEVRPISFRARDNYKIHGYLTLPKGVPPKNLPLVLRVHGGPWTRDTWGFNDANREVQFFANRGYAVLQINYRGSMGYGKAYVNAGNREWGGKMQDDLEDGVNWAIQSGYADHNKVAIVGGSLGGYCALYGVTFKSGLYRCAIDDFGISDVNDFLETMQESWKPWKGFLYNRIGNPEIEAERARLYNESPLHSIDRIQVPLLIAQGANDYKVKKSQSDRIVAEMRRHNKAVTYLVFPDEGHGFYVEDNYIKHAAAAEQFLAQNLGGRVEPIMSPKEDFQAFLG